VSTNARPQGGPGSVFLIDGSNFIFRAFHGLPTSLTTPNGVVVNAVHGFVRMIQALRKEFQPEMFVAVFDHDGDTFRSQLYPEYKAHRPPMPEDLVPQLPLVRGATQALGLPVIEVPGVEADDIIASYACAAQRSGHPVVIVSTDKDLMQLVDEGAADRTPIVLWDSMKSKLIGPAEVVEKWGVGPDKLRDLLALTGDSSDNVPGVPGIGPKTAAELLAQFGSLEGVLAGAASIKQAKRRESIEQNAAAARLSLDLVTLRSELPLPRPFAELKDNGPDPAAMEAFFAPLGFRSLLGGMRAAKAGADKPPEGPLELRPGAPLTLDPTRYHALVDAAALTHYVDAVLAKADRVALQVVVDVGESMRAALVGVALAPAGEHAPAPAYVPIAHTGDMLLSKHVPKDTCVAQLRRIADAKPLVAQGGKFQAIVLGRHGVPLGPIVMDPKIASYTLDPARASHSLADLAKDLFQYTCADPEAVLGKGKKALTFDRADVERTTRYACERAELALRVGQHLRPQIDESTALRALFDELEMPLLRVLQRIEERGIRVDAHVLARQAEAMGLEIAALRAKIAEHAGYDLNPDSPQQLQKLLFEDLGLETSRKTKTGFSTDAAVLEELAAYHPVVNLILEYRGLTKLKGTYLDTLPQEVNPTTGRLHTNFRQAVAQTGRLSSKDPNLQNIPIRTDVGRKIREAFVAGPGKVLVTLDYSQIELRILAHLSGDKNLVSAFKDGVDVHRRTAAEVFGVDEKDVTGEQRRVAKAVNFGVIYGQTAFGLARQLGIPRGKAGSYIKVYLEKIPGVTRYLDELVDIAAQRGYAETVFGRRRRIPELARKGAQRSYGERIARNTPIQGSAADIMKRAMIAVDAALHDKPWAAMLLTVHDELIFECDTERVADLVALARPLMEGAAGDKLSVPLLVESGSGPNWGACK
jgi:DNA polymerase-1